MATALRSPDREKIEASRAEKNKRSQQPRSHDVPFFTVAHYRSPISPTTYEVPVGPPVPIVSPTSLASFHDSDSSQGTLVGRDGLYNGSLDSSPDPSPVEIAFGPLDTQDDDTLVESGSSTSQLLTSSDSVQSIISQNGQDRSPVGCIHLASGNVSPGFTPNPHQFRKQKHDDTPVIGCSPFFPPLSRSASSSCKTKPVPPKKPTEWKRASLSSDRLDRPQLPPAQRRVKRHSVGEDLPKSPVSPPILKPLSSAQNMNNNDIKASIYDDAGVTVAGERLESRMSVNSCSSSSEQTPKTPRTPRSKSREPSFCLELDGDDYPKTDAEYALILHQKILQAHQRQLLPLKEDLADWLSKILGEKDLYHQNLLSRLNNGVIMCRLAEAITAKASDAKSKGISELEVPTLPYKIWPRARSGTFFARDNITNFLRFCNRLGVHENLLFETEDLVCGSGERAVVLCLLEVGRLATKWWSFEAPVLVKMERELEGEEMSTSSSPRDSNLALQSAAAPTVSYSLRFSRPKSAPLQTTDSVRSKMSTTASRPQSSSGIRPKTLSTRGPKPTPPPKPASIRSAISNLSKRRPTTFPSSRTYDRGWSGAKTTPTTPAATPTHGSRSRLPVACTPRSSGRSTPNTTPTTPTQSRKYLSSMQRQTGTSGIPRPTGLYGSRSSSTSLSSICPRRRNSQEKADEAIRLQQAGLDNKVRDIASAVGGVCNCVNPACRKPHVRRVADGKYDIYGKIFYVRLLNESHVMVRVGGGWDTLEHYLLRHEPTKITPFRTKRTDSKAVCIRARYCSKQTTSKAPQSSTEDERFPSMVAGSPSSSPKK